MVDKSLNKSPIGREENNIPLIFPLDVVNSFKYLGVKERLPEEVKGEGAWPIARCFVDDFLEEVEVHVVLNFFSRTVVTRKIASGGSFNEKVSWPLSINI